MGNFFKQHFGKVAVVAINSLLIVTGVLVIKNRDDEKKEQDSPEFSEVEDVKSKADALGTASENVAAETASVPTVAEQNKSYSANPSSTPAPKVATPVVRPKPVAAPAPAPAPKPAKKTKTS